MPAPPSCGSAAKGLQVSFTCCVPRLPVAQAPHAPQRFLHHANGTHWMHPALVAGMSEESQWKGTPAKSDIRAVLAKILQKGVQWAGILSLSTAYHALCVLSLR